MSREKFCWAASDPLSNFACPFRITSGIECARKNPFDEFANVRRVRAEHFQSLKHHLEALLKHSVVIKHRLEKSSKQETNNEPSQENCSSALEDENSSSPSAKDIAKQITLMYLLEAGQLESSDIDAQLNTNYCRKLSALASFFVKVSSDVQEAFFLFRNFNRKLDQNEALAMSRDDANKSNK